MNKFVWAMIFLIGWGVGAVTAALLILIAKKDPNLEHTANIISGFTTGLAAVIAAIALLVTWIQINMGRRDQRETTAYSIYGEQLRLGMDHPEFLNPTAEVIADKPEKYEHFVYHMLYACENIYLLSDSEEWRDAITLYMTPHFKYLRDDVVSDTTLELPFRNFLQGKIEKYRESEASSNAKLS